MLIESTGSTPRRWTPDIDSAHDPEHWYMTIALVGRWGRDPFHSHHDKRKRHDRAADCNQPHRGRKGRKKEASCTMRGQASPAADSEQWPCKTTGRKERSWASPYVVSPPRSPVTTPDESKWRSLPTLGSPIQCNAIIGFHSREDAKP
jgi:hypothetical protein